MPLNDISDDDLRKIVSLFEMAQHASREDASEAIRNEAATAFAMLSRLLAKYGLSLGDIPQIQQRHQEGEAVKAANTAAAASNQTEPNVLELVRYVLESYVDLKPHEYVTAALWILHTHVFDRFTITPRLALLSPVKGCGKSKLLLIAEHLTANPERHDNISAASIFRLIEMSPGTLLLDEGDNLGLKIDRNIRAVLNSDHLRGGHITRVIRGAPQAFSTFAPVAIAAIGTLTLPLLHRSIVLQMHRTLQTNLKTMELMNTSEETARLEKLHRHIVAWAQNVKFRPEPPLPKVLHGRAADNWRVLIAIADSFGAACWKTAREAAIIFAAGSGDEDALILLLYDIRTIFRLDNLDRIKSAVLVRKLIELEDGVGIWGAWRGENDDRSPHEITQPEIASLLRRLDGLRPQTIFERGSRRSRGPSGRGYYRKQFEPWWKIYCREDDDPADSGKVRRLHQKA
jgi:hypothetical protein